VLKPLIGAMSQSPSPYSEPGPELPQRRGPSSNIVAIVAIVSATILLLCGGLIGLGFYAVDRLAEQMADFADEFMWDEEEGAVALEFALAENDVVREQVGEIETVESEPNLTYDEDAGIEDYFYRVKGSAGEAIVVINFDYEEQRWFKSVELLDGNNIDAPRTRLSTRRPPFDTQLSKQVYDLLVADEGSLAGSLGVGEIQWIAYDYESSTEESDGKDLLFEVSGDSGAATLRARFQSDAFTTIRSLQVVRENGEGEQIFPAP
jgi:hypothetical protein